VSKRTLDRVKKSPQVSEAQPAKKRPRVTSSDEERELAKKDAHFIPTLKPSAPLKDSEPLGTLGAKSKVQSAQKPPAPLKDSQAQPRQSTVKVQSAQQKPQSVVVNITITGRKIKAFEKAKVKSAETGKSLSEFLPMDAVVGDVVKIGDDYGIVSGTTTGRGVTVYMADTTRKMIKTADYTVIKDTAWLAKHKPRYMYLGSIDNFGEKSAAASTSHISASEAGMYHHALARMASQDYDKMFASYRSSLISIAPIALPQEGETIDEKEAVEVAREEAGRGWVRPVG
jgi:hypothetical protein